MIRAEIPQNTRQTEKCENVKIHYDLCDGASAITYFPLEIRWVGFGEIDRFSTRNLIIMNLINYPAR